MASLCPAQDSDLASPASEADASSIRPMGCIQNLCCQAVTLCIRIHAPLFAGWTGLDGRVEIQHKSVLLSCSAIHNSVGLVRIDTLAERSKAVAQGAIPKGRGFEPHRCHFAGMFDPGLVYFGATGAMCLKRTDKWRTAGWLWSESECRFRNHPMPRAASSTPTSGARVCRSFDRASD